VDGEWAYPGKDFMDFFTMPYLEVFGAGAWGANLGWLPKLEGREAEIKPTRTMLAALKLYDMWPWLAYCNVALVQKYTALEKTFGVAEKDCRFVGYWDKDAAAVVGLPADMKSSFYVRPGKSALIYIANFNLKKQDIKCQFDFKKWDLEAFKAVDAESGVEIPTTTGPINLTVEGRDFRLLRLEKK
jgi:hypothetical protein